MAERLSEKMGMRRSFDSLVQEAMLNLLRSSDLMQIAFTRLFRAHSLSSPQYNILRILRGEGGDGLPCLEIASRMITCVPDITRLIDRLDRAGLVRRERSEADRRVIRVALTEEGRAVLDRLDGPVEELHRRLLGHLTAGELVELSRLLVKVRTRP